MVRINNPNAFSGEVYFKDGGLFKIPPRSFRDFAGKVSADIAYNTHGFLIKDMPDPVIPRKIVNRKVGDTPASEE